METKQKRSLREKIILSPIREESFAYLKEKSNSGKSEDDSFLSENKQTSTSSDEVEEESPSIESIEDESPSIENFEEESHVFDKVKIKVTPEGPESPVPSLIIEREPNRHDEPEELYEILLKKMSVYYRKLFIEGRHASSDISLTSNSKHDNDTEVLSPIPEESHISSYVEDKSHLLMDSGKEYSYIIGTNVEQSSVRDIIEEESHLPESVDQESQLSESVDEESHLSESIEEESHVTILEEKIVSENLNKSSKESKEIIAAMSKRSHRSDSLYMDDDQNTVISGDKIGQQDLGISKRKEDNIANAEEKIKDDLDDSSEESTEIEAVMSKRSHHSDSLDMDDVDEYIEHSDDKIEKFKEKEESIVLSGKKTILSPIPEESFASSPLKEKSNSGKSEDDSFLSENKETSTSSDKVEGELSSVEGIEEESPSIENIEVETHVCVNNKFKLSPELTESPLPPVIIEREPNRYDDPTEEDDPLMDENEEIEAMRSQRPHHFDSFSINLEENSDIRYDNLSGALEGQNTGQAVRTTESPPSNVAYSRENIASEMSPAKDNVREDVSEVQSQTSAKKRKSTSDSQRHSKKIKMIDVGIQVDKVMNIVLIRCTCINHVCNN